MDQYVSLGVDQYVSLGDRPKVAAALNMLTLQYWTRGDYSSRLSPWPNRPLRCNSVCAQATIPNSPQR